MSGMVTIALDSPHLVLKLVLGRNLRKLCALSSNVCDVSRNWIGNRGSSLSAFLLRRFPLNVRAISAKIKLPKNTHSMVTF